MRKGYNICLTEETHDKAVKNAERLGLSLSAYLAYLINKK